MARNRALLIGEKALFCVLVLLALFFSSPTKVMGSLKLDSLLEVLPTLKDSDRVNTLLHISKAYVNSDPRQSLSHAKEAFVESHQLGYGEGISRSLSLLAWSYFEMNEMEKAIRFYEKALKSAENQGNYTRMSSVITNISHVYMEKGELEKAIENQKKAIEVAKSLDDNKIHMNNEGTMGNLFYYNGNYEQAIEHYKNAFNYALLIDDSSVIGLSLLNIGNVYNFMEQTDSAKSYLNRALRVFEPINHLRGMSYCFNNLGMAYEKEESYENALNYHAQALLIKKQLEDYSSLAETYTNIGNVLVKTGKFNKAISTLQKGVELSKENGLNVSLKDCYRGISEAYRGTAQYKLAYEYDQKADSLENMILTEKNTQTLGEMEAKYQNEQQKRELTLLKKQRQIDELELQKQSAEISLQRRTLLISVLGVMALFTILLLFIARRSQKRRHLLEEELGKLQKLKAESELKRLEAQIEKTKATAPQASKPTTEKKEEILSSISVTKGDKIIVLKLEEITHFNSEDRYVFAHNVEGKKFIVDYSLSGLVKKLPDSFLRIHGSFIINREKVQEIRKGFKGRFVFFLKSTNEVRINSSRNYGPAIKSAFQI